MKPFNEIDWLDLMARLDRSRIELLRDSKNKTGCINLRHDVDDDLEASVRMAELEHTHGIRSTYYFLNTAQYWLWGDLDRVVAHIASLGHEIGWHNNAISDHLRSGRPLRTCIQEPINTLRRFAPVTGSASHGDPLCYDRGYLNYYIFKQCKLSDKFKPSIRFDRFDMKEFGLDYEAYHHGHNHYISESGGEWAADYRGVIERWNKNGGKLQILIHPQWWNI